MRKLVFILFCVTLGHGQSGVRSINGSLKTSQRLAIDTTATYFRWTISDGVHTLGIPYALLDNQTKADLIDTLNNTGVTANIDFTGNTLGVGAITSAGLSTFDSLKTEKLRFNGKANNPMQPGSMTWDSLQRTFKGWQYVVERSFDMTHNVLADSIVVGASTRSVVDTIVMGANYPSVGKVVETRYYGNMTYAGGGSKTFDFVIRKDSISGTLVDSVRYTSPAGAGTAVEFVLDHQLTFYSIGASARVHSALSQSSANGFIISSNKSTVNSTTANHYFVIMATNNAGSSITIDTGRTSTKN